VRRTACLLLTVAMVCQHSPYADTTSKARKVREMLVALHLEQMTNRIERAQEDRVEAISQQQLAGATLDADQKKAYDEFRAKVVELLRSSASWKALEPDFVKLYSDAYTEEEIDGILAFYGSPVGRAMLAKAPQLTEQSIAISQRRMTELAPKVQALMDQFLHDTL
jgi:uncharacterized protein